jgi:hypothetical protein
MKGLLIFTRGSRVGKGPDKRRVAGKKIISLL